jgi:hypothetical protein
VLANRIIRRNYIRKWRKEVGNYIAVISTTHEGCMCSKQQWEEFVWATEATLGRSPVSKE